MSLTPKDKAREVIDGMLEKAGCHIYDLKEANIHAHREIKTPKLKRAERERQTILEKFFQGDLVFIPKSK